MRTFLLLLLIIPSLAQAGFVDWWLTPDQQGQRLMSQGKYAEAARHFRTPERIGEALYKAKDFEGAAAAWGRSRTAEGAFNRGNALVLLGNYEQAIEAYQVALELRPGWEEAQDNLVLSKARLAALAPPEDDAGGTGGMLGADEIVFDGAGKGGQSDQQEVVEAGDQNMSEEAMRALWLRRVETRPGDFLAAKFNYQLATRGDDDEGEP